MGLILKAHFVCNAVLWRPCSSAGTSHHGAWKAGKCPGGVPPSCNALPVGLFPGQTCRYWNPAAAFNLLQRAALRAQPAWLCPVFHLLSQMSCHTWGAPSTQCLSSPPWLTVGVLERRRHSASTFESVFHASSPCTQGVKWSRFSSTLKPSTRTGRGLW